MALHRTSEFEIDVRGPGVDQRDAWKTRWKVQLTGRREVRFEQTPGSSGKVHYITLDDLVELVHALGAP